MKKDIYEMITNKIIKSLEKGVIPWHKPWSSSYLLPENFLTKKKYNGINILLLWDSGFNCKYWLGFKQIENLGGKVKKGEKGTFIVYYSTFMKKEEIDGVITEKNIPYIKYHYVWNLEQTEGIKYEKKEIKKIDFIPIEKAEKILLKMKNKPGIMHKGNRAYYNYNNDFICLPAKETFKSTDSYYSVLFHELTHSTMAIKRLNRESARDNHFGNVEYSKEELLAEIGSCFLCSESAIKKTFDNSISYISNWLEALKKDKKMILYAASGASKAVNYILDKK